MIGAEDAAVLAAGLALAVYTVAVLVFLLSAARQAQVAAVWAGGVAGTVAVVVAAVLVGWPLVLVPAVLPVVAGAAVLRHWLHVRRAGGAR